MEIIDSNEPLKPKKLSFKGDGMDYFGVLIINGILNIITVGLYYPWARFQVLSFIYSNTEFEGSRFTFLGTGKQMFYGFIKAIIIFLAIYSLVIYGRYTGSVTMILTGLGIFYFGLLILIPLAYHGGLRYRLAKTAWRNIHFGYRGDRLKLMKIFIPGTILTTLTLGIYGSWLKTDLRKYIIGNIRFGNIEFRYTGTGTQLFRINFEGILFGIITFGIYLFWYFKNWIEFYLNSIEVVQNGISYPVKAKIKTIDFIEFQLINFLLLSITFGLANAWVQVRKYNFFFERIEIPAEINADTIEQTETDFSDATGDDFLGMLDIGIV